MNVELEAISRLAHRYDCLVIVDAISSLSSVPVETEAWELDVVASGSQKGWMTAPGLAFVSVSERAWERQAQVRTPRFYFDLGKARSYLETGQTPWTPAVSVLFQLDRALEMMLAEGMDNIFERHRRLARRTREGVKALGLELFAREGVESETVTAVKVPEGIDGRELVRIAHDEFNTVFAGGQADLGGKIFRFGHLGYVSEPDVDAGLEALAGTLERLGHAPVAGRA
jgi:aspartate aminotransferase-like enzyme